MRIYSDKVIDPTLSQEQIYHGTRVDRHIYSHPLLGRIAEIHILSGAYNHGISRTPSVRSRECHINVIKVIIFAVIAPFQWIVQLFRPSSGLLKCEDKLEVKDLQVVESDAGDLSFQVSQPEAVDEGWEVIFPVVD